MLHFQLMIVLLYRLFVCLFVFRLVNMKLSVNLVLGEFYLNVFMRLFSFSGCFSFSFIGVDLNVD